MPSNHARNVALTSELSDFVDELVASGNYANASEVMRAGLRALKDRHALEEIRERLVVALDQIDRGEGIVGEPGTVIGGVLEEVLSRRTR